MAYDDDALGGAGSDSGSNGVSASTVPLAIKKALKPRNPISAGAARSAQLPSNAPQDAVYDPIFDNYDWNPPYVAENHEEASSPSAQELGASSTEPHLPPMQPEAPTLAPQGSRNPFVRAIQRITGWTGPQPKPGQPYTGPTTTEAKLGVLGKWLGRLSNSYNENFGTPLDRELALKRQELSNEAGWRAANLREMERWHEAQGDIRQQQADTAQNKMLGDMRRYGYALNDPNDPNSGFRSLTENEILSDPELGTRFKAQMAKIGLNDAQTDKIRDMLLGRFDVDPWIAAVAGDPSIAGQKVSAQQFQNIGKVLQAKGIQIKDLGTEGMWAVDRIGNRIHQVSAVGPSVARAQMYNMFRSVNAITPEGNLEIMPAGQAWAMHAAPAGPGVSAISKQAQMQDIKVASQQMRSAINQLENPLPADTIAELTMAARSTDPTVYNTLVDSLFGSQQLSRDQYQFLTWLGQLQERAMSLRNIAGMGQASDKLREAIIATLPSMKDANRELMITKLNAFDNMVENLEKGIPSVGRPATPIHHAVQSHGEGAKVRIKASDGGIHELPAANLSKARERDPGLQVIQ